MIGTMQAPVNHKALPLRTTSRRRKDDEAAAATDKGEQVVAHRRNSQRGRHGLSAEGSSRSRASSRASSRDTSRSVSRSRRGRRVGGLQKCNSALDAGALQRSNSSRDLSVGAKKYLRGDDQDINSTQQQRKRISRAASARDIIKSPCAKESALKKVRSTEALSNLNQEDKIVMRTSGGRKLEQRVPRKWKSNGHPNSRKSTGNINTGRPALMMKRCSTTQARLSLDKNKNRRSQMVQRAKSMSKIQRPVAEEKTGIAWWGDLVADTKPQELHRASDRPRPTLDARKKITRSQSQPLLMDQSSRNDEEYSPRSDTNQWWLDLVLDAEPSSHEEDRSETLDYEIALDRSQESHSAFDKSRAAIKRRSKSNLSSSSGHRRSASKSRDSRRSSSGLRSCSSHSRAPFDEMKPKRRSTSSKPKRPSSSRQPTLSSESSRSTHASRSLHRTSSVSSRTREPTSIGPENELTTSTSSPFCPGRPAEIFLVPDKNSLGSGPATKEPRPTRRLSSHSAMARPTMIRPSYSERHLSGLESTKDEQRRSSQSTSARPSLTRPTLQKPSYSERHLSGLEPTSKSLSRAASSGGLLDDISSSRRESRQGRRGSINFDSGCIVIPDTAGTNAKNGMEKRKKSKGKALLKKALGLKKSSGAKTGKDRHEGSAPCRTTALHRENSFTVKALEKNAGDSKRMQCVKSSLASSSNGSSKYWDDLGDSADEFAP